MLILSYITTIITLIFVIKLMLASQIIKAGIALVIGIMCIIIEMIVVIIHSIMKDKKK